MSSAIVDGPPCPRTTRSIAWLDQTCIIHYPQVVGQLCDLDVEGAHLALLRRVLLTGTPDEGVLEAFVVMVCSSYLSRAHVPSLFPQSPRTDPYQISGSTISVVFWCTRAPDFEVRGVAATQHRSSGSP